MARAYIYGDSLLKATVPDEQFRYHFHLPEVMERYSGRQTEVVNRSKMGATVRKGQALLEHDLRRGMQADYALIAYGGNDSDFDWDAVQAHPQESHLPRTTLADFKEILLRMIRELRERGVQPVLMTLPPIDAQRYLDFLCREGRSRERIMTGWGTPSASTAIRSCTRTPWRGWPTKPARPSSACGRYFWMKSACSSSSLPTAST